MSGPTNDLDIVHEGIGSDASENEQIDAMAAADRLSRDAESWRGLPSAVKAAPLTVERNSRRWTKLRSYLNVEAPCLSIQAWVKWVEKDIP